MSCTIDTHGTRCNCGAADPSPTPTVEPEPAEPPPWCDCKKGQRVSVRLTILPRPLPLFGQAVTIQACPACYAEKRQRGQILSQQPIASDS